jgi:predicted Zn-dependent protease
MSAPKPPDQFAVSRRLASATAVGVGILVPLAILLVVAAQVWTCFEPSPRARLATTDHSQLLSVNLSVPTHQVIESALQDVWNAAGRTDTFALVLVRSDEINAASVGGGRFLVWEGVASLPPWAVRGVMAHEVAHDVLKHARKATELQDVVDFVGQVVSLLGHADDPDVDLTVQRWARNATLPHYSRSQEYQADSLGAVLLTNMAYDGPQAMAATLRVLLDRYGNVEGGFLDYHPSVRDRIAALSTPRRR